MSLETFEQLDREVMAQRAEAMRQATEFAAVSVTKELRRYRLSGDLPDHDEIPDEDILVILQHQRRQLQYLKRILGNLGDFGPTAYDYFYRGFFDEDSYLERDERVPPRAVLRNLLAEMSTDFSIIQQAIFQRRFDKHHLSQEMLTLFMADKLAADVVNQAVSNGTLKFAAPLITSLAPHVSVRLIPYWQAILLTLPYVSMSSMDNTLGKDYLVIPHEVGHFVYWMGFAPDGRPIHQFIDEELSALKIKQRDWRRNWVEELAADLFGLLTAGPIMALDFQDMVNDDLPAHFTADVDKHPISVLRPIFQNTLLRFIPDENGERRYKLAPYRLDKNWTEWLQANRPNDNPFDQKVKFKVARANKKMSMDEIIDQLEVVGEILFAAFGLTLDPKTGKPLRAWTPWTDDMEEGTDNVFELFEEFLARDFDWLHELEEEGISQANERANLRAYQAFYPLINAAGQNGKAATQDLLRAWLSRRSNDSPKCATRDWLPLAFMPGWSSEGPTGTIGGGIHAPTPGDDESTEDDSGSGENAAETV